MVCEFNQVKFLPVVRLVFKPLIDALPIAGDNNDEVDY